MGKIVNRMRVVMAEKRIGLTELSEVTGLHRNTLANLRDGTPTARWDTLEAVANAMGVSPWEMFVWVEDGNDE